MSGLYAFTLLMPHTCYDCCVAGRLMHGMLMGFDNPRMEGLWPTEEECPGFQLHTDLFSAWQPVDHMAICSS